MSGPSVWTSRDAHFRCFPRTPDDRFDAFFDDLVDHYWETWRHRVLGTLIIGSHGDGTCVTVEVCGWPRWVPAAAARRSLAALAAKHDVGGEATFVVVRSVLPNWPGTPTHPADADVVETAADERKSDD